MFTRMFGVGGLLVIRLAHRLYDGRNTGRAANDILGRIASRIDSCQRRTVTAAGIR